MSEVPTPLPILDGHVHVGGWRTPDFSGRRTDVADAERRKTLGAAGQDRMQKEFSIATMADKHVNLYETILNG